MDKEKDKEQAYVIVRYLLFYCCLITVLSLVSYFLDLYFCRYDFGHECNYGYSAIQYFPYYIIIGFFIFPFSFIYNFLVNKLPQGFHFSKFIFGILLTLIIGYFMNHRYHFGYYIGEYRPLKNFIAMILSGILIEIIRFLVVRSRYRTRL